MSTLGMLNGLESPNFEVIRFYMMKRLEGLPFVTHGINVRLAAFPVEHSCYQMKKSQLITPISKWESQLLST